MGAFFSARTVVKATCTDCEQYVFLNPLLIVLHIAVTADDLVGPDSFYEFICPNCDEIVHRTADTRVATLLLGSNCQWETNLVTAP